MRPVLNRFLAVALGITALCLCFVLAFPAQATVVNSGSCGENATWTLTENGTLTVSGSGEMIDATSLDDIGWWDIRESIVRIVVEDGITHIGDYAFYKCVNVTDISVPESVTSLGMYAFAGCDMLTDITIPGPITALPRSVFESCDILSNISLPNTLLTVGENAFYSCKALTDSPLPDSVTTIERDAFGQCTGLRDVTLPQSLKTLNSYAFVNCTYMTSVTFGPNLRTIDYYAFLYCHFLTEITFQGNAPELDSDAFARITATCYYPYTDSTWQGVINSSYGGTITWTAYTPENAEPVGGSCGDNLQWTLTNDGALVISGTGAMYDYHSDPAPWYGFRVNLKKLVVEEGVTSLGNAAFEDCRFFQVQLPETLKSIGNVAFTGCSNLTQIDLPASVETLGNAPFLRCENLLYVTAASNSPYLVNDDQGVLFNKDKTILYWASPATMAGVYTVPETVTAFGQYPFYGCKGLERIILSPNLKEIGDSDFAYCSRLTRITIPASVTSIGGSAFDGCYALKEILFCGDAPAFSSYAFSSLTANVYYPADNDTWNDVISSTYTGKITWVPCDVDTFCQSGHSYGDWFYTLTPRCLIDGVQRQNCANCAAFEETTATATGHVYHQTVTPAGEDTVGYSLYTCTGCGVYMINFNDYNNLTRSDAILQIRYLVSEQAKSISVSYYDTVPGSTSLAEELFELAAGHGTAPYFGDYLTRHPFYKMTCSGGGYSVSDGLYRNTVSYSVTHTTTYAAEEYVDSKIAMILEQLDFAGKSDLEKITLIHDYVCNHVVYATSSMTEHTCYGALRYGQAACQGYALLTYRLMMESGIDCRFISGTSRNQPHGWNIVRLGDVYYNIDTTWDDSYSGPTYNYFLRADSDFDDHIRDAEYATEEFYAQYPMAQSSYFFGSDRNVTWVLTPDGTLTVSGAGILFNDPCPDYADRVKKLVLEEGITNISMDVFQNYTALTDVTLPKSLEFIGFDAFEGCTALQNANYLGYASDRSKLSIASGNDPLLQTSWTYAVCEGEHSYEFVCSPLCSICGFERTTQHTPGSWQSDEDHHWKDCAICGTAVEKEQHSFVDGCCSTCGKEHCPGDYTGDGQVTNEDVIYLLWHTLFPETYPISSSGDFTDDDQVTNEDVIYLLWHTLFPETYPI